MASKQDFKAAQQRIFTRPRTESKSDQELLRKTEDDGVYPSQWSVKSVRLDRIKPDAKRPARAYSDESLAELGRSLIAHGQLVPIVVEYQSDDDSFVLIDGERRWRAAQKAGLRTLHAVIIERIAPSEHYEKELVAALHQGAWDARERMQALHDYKAAQGLATWPEVAQRLGVSEATIDAMLRASVTGPDAAAGDAVSQVEAATHVLDLALSRLQAGEGNSADIAQLLKEVDDCLSEHRTRLIYSRGKKEPEEPGKPVRNMPAWGQG
jgi:ParB family chromosome partitioning protein